ncbi:hypothetical protein ECC02_012767 [Trypanosoma cruzi]|uniref:Uncharacterized protein n=1 Tax=Trypanosoma cruzi TaxID=5693 RepID=A0A7J6XK51_TRYCR|nr:hypothetical protein ECC02_012767 [Trypanosoma cruzi]
MGTKTRKKNKKKTHYNPRHKRVKIMEEEHHRHQYPHHCHQQHHRVDLHHHQQQKQKTYRTKTHRQNSRRTQKHRNSLQGMLHKGSTVMTQTQRIRRRMQQPAVQLNQQHSHLPLQVAAVIMSRIRQIRMMLKALKDNTTALKLATPTLFQHSVRQHHKQQKQPPPLKRKIRRRLATVTAAPRSPTPPSLFCFFLLLRLLLRWWPRESEGERAVHRPHTHSSFTLCVCPLAWTLALTSSHEAHT